MILLANPRIEIYRKIKELRAQESSNGPLFGKSSLACHGRAKQLNVYHKCAKWIYDGFNPFCVNKCVTS